MGQSLMTRVSARSDNCAIENEFLTPTMKIRRNKIEVRFGERAQELARKSAVEGQILLDWVG